MPVEERQPPKHTAGQAMIVSGTSHPALAQEICQLLDLTLTPALVTQFRNEETRVQIEENVRGADVFVVQSMCSPIDHHIIELFLMIDALRRASAARVTAVIPYFAYAKQEKKMAGREPISAKVIAKLIETVGADRVLTIDLHAPAIEGFFDIPVDHLRAAPMLAAAFTKLKTEHEVVVVSPDAGGVARANDFRARIGSDMAIISKTRPATDVTEVIDMVGDVRGRCAIIVDDMISTGSTMIEAVEAVCQRGADEVYACATHPIFAGDAVELIHRSPLKGLITTNTIPVPRDRLNSKITLLTVAPLLANAIARIHDNRSVSELFN
ncbi:MAG TPA: ribose-phosphate pyrophosphokinase [Chloroflexota bacterium]|nr:ribose-phosphate pyrophosphokinase [Chloroflexota bacterium]